jgi:ATP-dependent metalloprotease
MDLDVDLEQISRGTPGFSGAELFNLINQAALKSSVDGLKSVSMHALEWAKDKIMMGAERKSAIISPETMKMTAFHEAGHALVALKTKGADPIHKATIMPRGRALGMVMQLPDGDQTSITRQQMLARLDVCMGGRVAEEVIFGQDQVTSGASSDIQQATKLARAMVTKYGLSSKVGLMFIDDKQPNVSGHTQEEVDKEVRALLNDSYQRAKKVIEGYSTELTLVANGLMEYESLSGSEVVDLINNRKLSQLKRSQKPSRVLQAIPPSKPARPSEIPIPVPPALLNDSASEPLTSSNATNDAVLNKAQSSASLHNEQLSQPSKNTLAPPSTKAESNSTVIAGELSNSSSHIASPSSSQQTSQKATTPQRGPPKN